MRRFDAKSIVAMNMLHLSSVLLREELFPVICMALVINVFQLGFEILHDFIPENVSLFRVIFRLKKCLAFFVKSDDHAFSFPR